MLSEYLGLFSLLAVSGVLGLIVSIVLTKLLLKYKFPTARGKYKWFAYSFTIVLVEGAVFLYTQSLPELGALFGIISGMIALIASPVAVLTGALILAEVIAGKIEKKN